TSLLLIVLTAPAVLAFHTFFGLPWWGWTWIPVQTLALWALPFGVGAAAALLMLRVVPARHAREALGLVSSLTLFTLWLADAFLLPRLGGEHGTLSDFRGALAVFARGMPGTPGGWLAAALGAEVAGHAAHAALETVRLAGAGGLSLALLVWVASVHLEPVQARLLVAPRRRGRIAPARARLSRSPVPLGRAVLARDARLIGRNWTVLGDLLATVVLWTLLPVVFGPVVELSRDVLARMLLLALAVAVGSETAARAVPLERGALVWARLAPTPPAHWLAARLWGAALL